MTAARAEQRTTTHQAARGSALNLIGAVTAAVVGFVTVGVVTNVYEEAGAGVFFAATALFTLAANASRLGAESGLTLIVSRLRATDRHHIIRPTVNAAVTATLATAAAVSVVGLVVAGRLGAVLTDDPASARTATVMVRILAVAVPAFAVSQVLFGASRGFGTMRPSVVVGQIVRPVTQLAAVAAVVLLTTAVWPLALAWSVAAMVAAVPIVWWTTRRLARADANARSGPAPGTGSGPPRNGSVGYWRFAGPRAVADLLSAALERLDLLLVAALVGEAGAGLYGASSRLILVGQMMMIATAQSMAPHLAAAFQDGRTGDARQLLRTLTGWNVTLLWPLFIGLGFGAETALSVFGPGFASAEPVVVVLAATFLIITGLGVGDTLLLMTGDSTASLVNHAVAVVVMVGLSIWLLPMVGVIGAAWAWAASRLVLRGLAVWRVAKTTGVHAFHPAIAVAAVVCLAAYVPTGLATSLVLDAGWAAVAIHAVTGGTVHLLLLRRFGGPLDLDRLATVARRR